MERLGSLESQLNEMFDSSFKLHCYTYCTYGYPVRIICASFPEDDLGEGWEPLNNAIATILQSQIQNPVERYNIYLLIFELHISMELRAKIENDRYCCRKIVVPESMPEDNGSLEVLVGNRLFGFIDHTEPHENVQSIQAQIYSTDPSGQLLDLISNLKARISDEEAQRVMNIL